MRAPVPLSFGYVCVVLSCLIYCNDVTASLFYEHETDAARWRERRLLAT